MTVLENKSNGKLEMSGSYASGAMPISVAAADLDGDGRVDLVTNGITIFLNEVAAAFSKDGNKNGIPDECESVLFHRGDPNDDGQINLTDAVHILHFLFLGGEPPPCMESANVNDDEAINLTDAISLLQYLFLSGAPPAAPGPLEAPCGPDPANSPVNLGCQSYAHCQ